MQGPSPNHCLGCQMFIATFPVLLSLDVSQSKPHSLHLENFFRCQSCHADWCQPCCYICFVEFHHRRLHWGSWWRSPAIRSSADHCTCWKSWPPSQSVSQCKHSGCASNFLFVSNLVWMVSSGFHQFPDSWDRTYWISSDGHLLSICCPTFFLYHRVTFKSS